VKFKNTLHCPFDNFRAGSDAANPSRSIVSATTGATTTIKTASAAFSAATSATTTTGARSTAAAIPSSATATTTRTSDCTAIASPVILTSSFVVSASAAASTATARAVVLAVAFPVTCRLPGLRSLSGGFLVACFFLAIFVMIVLAILFLVPRRSRSLWLRGSPLRPGRSFGDGLFLAIVLDDFLSRLSAASRLLSSGWFRLFLGFGRTAIGFLEDHVRGVIFNGSGSVLRVVLFFDTSPASCPGSRTRAFGYHEVCSK
jgi:hypothetical protein